MTALSWRLPQRAEEFADIAEQQVECLHRREVTATLEFGPADDGVGLLGESANRRIALSVVKTATAVGTVERSFGAQAEASWNRS